MVTRGNFGTGHLGFVHWIGNAKEIGRKLEGYCRIFG